ncbi:trichoplein keratin filament-binding protein-like [Dendronephthya gigantea]|uniref:trichoplein keratin filament-binding protein-like n=1 Tax=Dendronephthya gigantea TaxID=151771 RepID=UPI00106C0A98|nr:trichoplein keratin filament-binding protein-like [Dendronephthya gigantea]
MGSTNSKEVFDVGESVTSTPGTAKAISYEVILSPRVQNARQPQLTPKREGMLTRQDIDEKLVAAERRRKMRQLDMRLKLAHNDGHAEVVRQAMTDYEERKRRETEARYQRRLFIFAENQGTIAAERAEQWEEKAKRIEAAKEIVQKREKSFRESVKEKLSQKFDRFKENYAKYQKNRQVAAQMQAEKIDVVKESKERQIEEKATATAEKIGQKFEASQENREATINERISKVQKQQAKIEEAKEYRNHNLEVSSAKKLMQLEVRLDRSAVKRQLFEAEIRKKAQADLDKVEQAKKLREQHDQQFSMCTKENLAQKFENAKKVREQNMVVRQQVWEKQAEQKAKVKNSVDHEDSQKLREKIDEKQQRTEENRNAILNAKVEQCQRESSKVKQTKEIVEEQIRQQEKVAEEKLQTKLNTYKENRQRRLAERKVPVKTSNRPSLQEITNERDPVRSPTIEECKKESCNENGENQVDGGKLKELAENFRNRNLEYLGLR